MAPKKAAAAAAAAAAAGAKTVADASTIEAASKGAASGTKRAAEAAPAEEPASKRLAATLKKHGVSPALYRHVVEIFEHPLVDHLSQDSREMLLAVLPHSLCVPSDERQEFQEATVQMMSQQMSQVLATMQASLDAENEKVAGSEAKKAELEENIRAAEVSLNEAQDVTAAHQAELNAACSATRSACAERTRAKEVQKANDDAQTSAQTDKDALEAAVAGDFEKLKSGDVGDVPQETLYQNLERLLLKLDLDMSLRSATKPALLKDPAGRGLFDGKVVEELEKSFAAKIAELSSKITDGQPACEACAAVVTQAEGKVAGAEAVQTSAADVLATSRAAQKEAQASVKTAKACLSEYKPEYKKATEARDKQQEQVQTFMDVNVASFNVLVAKISAKKKKAMAAAAAAVAAAATAAAAAEAEAEAKVAADAEAATKAEGANEEVSEVAATEAGPVDLADKEAAVNSIAEVATEMSVEEVPKLVEAPVPLAAAANFGA